MSEFTWISDKKSTWTLDTNRMNYCVGTFMSYVLSYYAIQCIETMTESLSVLKIAVWKVVLHETVM